ncbi:mercuric reductase [Kiritimatiellaeota bacterium B1221]|nr:mercuric reductase [Kiritimatiellaeota bacterium B1221]
MTANALLPLDPHNQRLQENVHPEHWQNPEPSGKYNLVVIGAGTAGLVAASAAAGLGAKVALIERSLMGGDCLNVGCVPSKALIASARRVAAVKHADRFGVKIPDEVEIDFGKAMARMRKLRADISPADSARRYKEMGIDVFLGQATFLDAGSLKVGEKKLSFSKAAICTGARAAAPNIPGLDRISYLTNETLFSLTELPRRFAILGAGPVGCEMAQTFARLGSAVTLITSKRGVLPNEDPEASAVIHAALKADGVRILGNGKDLQVKKDEDGIQLHLADKSFSVDQLLIAIGRKPNLEGLALAAAGVEATGKGILVNDRLQTTNKHIYAAGDVCSDYQFTHAADFMARNLVQNALFFGRAKTSNLVIPWSTYTEPELAQVGLTPLEANTKGIEIDSFKQDLAHVDRSLLEGDTEGFVKVHVKKGSDQILGATVVGANAGDLISYYTLAINQKIGLKGLAGSIFPYPTHAEVVRKTGDLYNRTRLTPTLKNIMTRFLSLRR